MSVLLDRDQVFVDQNGTLLERPYYYLTPKQEAIRWAIWTGILLFFALYMIIGYQHAKRRLKKGLKPLAYHRWLLSQEQRAIHEPRFRVPMPYYAQYPPQQFGMQPYPAPMYGQEGAPPPTYQPPPGATKIDPSQRRAEPTRRPTQDGAPEYTAPGGPPPAQLRPE